MLQRNKVRQRYELEGSACEDWLLSLCCGPCSIVQVNKETNDRYGHVTHSKTCTNNCSQFSITNDNLPDLGKRKNTRRARDLEEWHTPLGKNPFSVAEYCQLGLIETRRDLGLSVVTAKKEYLESANCNHISFIEWLQKDIPLERNPLPQWARDYWITHNEDGTILIKYQPAATMDMKPLQRDLLNFSFSNNLPLKSPYFESTFKSEAFNRDTSYSGDSNKSQQPISLEKACKLRTALNSPQENMARCGCSAGIPCTCDGPTDMIDHALLEMQSLRIPDLGSHQQEDDSSPFFGYIRPGVWTHKESGGSELFQPAFPTPPELPGSSNGLPSSESGAQDDWGVRYNTQVRSPTGVSFVNPFAPRTVACSQRPVADVASAIPESRNDVNPTSRPFSIQALLSRRTEVFKLPVSTSKIDRASRNLKSTESSRKWSHLFSGNIPNQTDVSPDKEGYPGRSDVPEQQTLGGTDTKDFAAHCSSPMELGAGDVKCGSSLQLAPDVINEQHHMAGCVAAERCTSSPQPVCSDSEPNDRCEEDCECPRSDKRLGRCRARMEDVQHRQDPTISLLPTHGADTSRCIAPGCTGVCEVCVKQEPLTEAENEAKCSCEFTCEGCSECKFSGETCVISCKHRTSGWVESDDWADAGLL